MGIILFCLSVCLFIYPNGHNMFKETIYVTIQMSMATSCQDNNKHSYQDTILSRYNILLLYLGSVTISLVWGWWIGLKVIVITSGKNSNYCNILDGDMDSCTFNYQPHILDTLPNCSSSIIKWSWRYSLDRIFAVSRMKKTSGCR